jgi:hypothetical protein
MQVLVMGGEEHFVNHKTSLTPRNDFQYSLQFVSARPVEYIPQSRWGAISASMVDRSSHYLHSLFRRVVLRLLVHVFAPLS